MPDNSHIPNVPADMTPSKPSDQQHITVKDDPRKGNDALCFTPGFPGAAFGAGVIHAYLAADRDPPQVVAGISLGTVSAAVMQRCYADLLKAENDKLDGNAVEAERWKFFRKYLSFITDRPFQVIWKGIPDPADFMAELPPIRDPVPDTLAESVRDEWKKDELDSRRELYLLVKFGHWMARLPVRVSAIANTIVTYVRAKEKYSSPTLIRWAEYILWQVAVVTSLILHILRVPARFPHYKFEPWKEKFDLPEWLIALRARLLFPREDTKWGIFVYRASILFAASMCASRSATWGFYQLRSHPHEWVVQSVYGAIFLVSGFTTISLSAVWLFIKDGLVLRLVAAVWCALSLALLFLFPWAFDPSSYFPTDHPVVIFWNILTALLYLSVLLALSESNKFIRKLWFQACSAIAWIFQRPLFGAWVYLASAAILAILQLWTANLAILFLDLIWRGSAWVQAVSCIGAAVSLFFTTSLATWWIPMKGKFPFRAIPMVCSVGSVAILMLAQAQGFRDWFLVWVPNFDSSHIYGFLAAFWSFFERGTLFSYLAYLIRRPILFSCCVLLMVVTGIVVFLIRRLRAGLIKFLLKKVAMQRHIVHDYHLRWALTSLFGDHADSPPLTSEPFPLVMVATPLQSIGAEPTLNNQLWARIPKKGAPADTGNERGSASAGSTTPNELPPMLVDVLRATLAVPAVFDPYQVCGAKAKIWSNQAKDSDCLDLVDAAIVRQNPLPALFSFLQRNPEIAKELESNGVEDAKVHVVYNVPTQVARANGSAGGDSPSGAENAPQGLHPSTQEQHNGNLTDIVDVALLSMRLAQRRDINLEIDQTNFISKLARVSRDLAGKLPSATAAALAKDQPPNEIFPIFADHIVPPGDLNFKNSIAPKKQEVLRHAAAGCKATLQRLYAHQINKMNETCSEVNCSSFLAARRRLRDPRFKGSAGLPEICRHCDQRLDITPGPAKKAAFDQQEVDKWRKRNDLATEFKQLTSEEPRIVFIASGGVFRGPFHAGMINAMMALEIKPDLIVGASVGTLVGGALGATLATRDRQTSLKVLGDLVDTFQNVDERIAFTHTLKNAARELGLRSRMVDLAPCELRKKILEGSKGDPGFAVTGTPPILIDAISDVLLIPHKATSRIAAQFVAGHFTEAVRLLLAGMKRETLRRLDIVHAVMGTSLLEPAARRLLGGGIYNMNSSQPYNSGGIAIFGTSTDLINEQPVLLGRYKFDLPSYDFIKACLASSAFPAVFAPRKDSEIFPGLGDPEVVYSDGGMFDNLPIAPALEILTASQRNWIKINQKDAVQELDRRLNNPDLFFTGSLDVNPSPDEKIFDDVVSINKRAGTLQNNIKIQAFEEVCRLIGEHFRHLHRIVKAYKALPGSRLDSEYLNGLVNAVLFAVYPLDKDHLNGTFQFCNSLGRKLKVVNRSMADGCFQTMAELTFAFGKPNRNRGRTKAVQNFARKRRMPVLGPSRKRVSEKNPKGPGYYCPFFAKWENGERIKFVCPFSENPVSVAVFESCRKDRKHRRQYKQHLVEITPWWVQDNAMAQPF